MELQGKLLGAWLLAYFVSRAAVRLPLPLRGLGRTVLAHVASFAAIIALVAAIRGAAAALSGEMLMACLPPQFFWLLYDLLRKHRPGSIAKKSR